MEEESEYVRVIASRIKNEELRALYTQQMTEILATLNAPPILNYRDIKHELPYGANLHLYKPSVHIGHRKLFLTELRFFCRFVEPEREQVVLYTGASPWTHGGLLMRLFPSVKFILVDPVAVNAYGVRAPSLITLTEKEPLYAVAKRHLETIRTSREKVFSFRCLFGNEFARAVKDVFPEIYFVSDIRTKTGKQKHVDTLDIIWNSAQQMNWMFTFQPTLSMLKFRHPYYEPESLFKKLCNRGVYKADFDLALQHGVDFRGNYDSREFVYLAGEIDVQPWPGTASTESRLIVAKPFQLANHGMLQEWEDKYFYYTSVARPHGHYFNPNADASLNFCNCNDCALENYIWEQYREKYDDRMSVGELVVLLGTYVNKDVRGTKLHSHCYTYRELVQNAKLHNDNLAHKEKKKK